MLAPKIFYFFSVAHASRCTNNNTAVMDTRRNTKASWEIDFESASDVHSMADRCTTIPIMHLSTS